MLDRDVLALYVAEITEPLGECPPKTRTLRVGWRDIAQNTYPKDSRLLRFASDRRSQRPKNVRRVITG